MATQVGFRPETRAAESVLTHVQTLGQFKVQVAGRPLHLETKSGKPLQLLKALVALGSESVSVERLTESLWPDSDGDKAYGAFTITLRRLRELIGHNSLILRVGRLSLGFESVRVDAVEYATEASRAERLMRAGSTDQASVHVARALDLYRGPFLPGDFDLAEILSARTQLHSMFLRVVEAYGNGCERDERIDEAIALYRKGLEADDQAEPFYRGLLRCYLARRRLLEAVSLYQRCRDLLQATAGASPSPETEVLYRAVLDAQRIQAAPGDSQKAPTVTEPAIPSVPLAPDAGEPGKAAGALATEPLRSEPERRIATVLCFRFAVHDTAGEGEIDPEELTKLYRRLHSEAEQIVSARGGVLVPFAGTTTVAWFGMPEARDDDPVRAVRSALAMRERAAGFGPGAGKEPSTALHAGIATGTFVVKGPGTVPTQDTVGAATTRCVDLASAAKAGQILADRQTWSQVRDFFSGRGRLSPRDGQGAGPEAVEILSSLNVESRFEVARRRGLSPFTGREWELQTLQHFLGTAGAGAGQVISIVGEAGIGKSRLLHEFRESIDAVRVTVLEGRCPSHDGGVPYGPILDLVRSALGLKGSDAVLTENLVVTKARAISSDLGACLPALLHLLSIPSAEYRLPEALRGVGLRRELEEAFVRLMTALSGQAPLVLVCEDWHWADEASEGTLNALIAELRERRILIVTAYRSEFRPIWHAADQHRALTLRPLDPYHTGRLLRAVFGIEQLPEGLEHSVHERTQGNALFVEEMARALLEEGIVTISGSTASLARPPEDSALPATVRGVIQARVDRLDSPERETLRLASAIGHSFDEAILLRLAPRAAQVGSALARLVDQDLIRPVRASAQTSYRFKHVLTREVVYDSLLLTQRRELHGRIGELIASVYADRVEQFCETLADHYARGDRTDKAVDYLELAGDKAIRQSAVEAARAHYQRALNLLGPSNPDAGRAARAIDVTHKLAAISEYAPSVKMLEDLEAARLSSATLGDEARLAATAYWMGRTHYILGRLPDALSCFENAMRLAEQLDDRTLRTRCMSALGRTCVYTAEHQRGIGYLAGSLESLQGERNLEEIAYSSHVLGLHYGTIGEFDKALDYAQRGLSIAVERKMISRQPMAQNQLAWLQGLRGDFAAALRTLDGARQVTQRAGDTYTLGIASVVEGWLRFMCGEQFAGIRLMTQGVERVEAIGSNMALTQWYGLLAEALALVHDADEALIYATRAIDIAKGGQRHGECIAHRAMGVVASVGSRDDREAADRWMESSVRIAGDLSERPYRAISHLRYAEILVQRGDAEGGQRQATAAREYFGQMGMTGWVPLLPM